MDNYTELVQRLKSKASFVVVVGTGVSVAASNNPKLASWQGLLSHGFDFLRTRGLLESKEIARIEALLEHDLVSCAKTIQQTLTDHKLFEDWLKETVGSLKLHKPGLIETLHRFRTKRHFLTTTNYDSLLIEEKNLPPVLCTDEQGFRQLLQYTLEGVLYLHGHWQTPDSIVLDLPSYIRILRRHPYIDDFWKNHPWLFIGCGPDGLDDPHFGTIYNELSAEFARGGLFDYVLCRESALDDFAKIQTRNHPNLKCVVYGKENDDLPGFLTKLADEAFGPRQFSFIRKDLDWFRPENGPATVNFKPTYDEIAGGTFPKSHLAATATTLLEEKAIVWLCGHGGSGKTTLAMQLALASAHRVTPLYLNLARIDNLTAVKSEFAAYPETDRTFVLDDAQAAPDKAIELAKYWEDNDYKGKLLIVSRQLSGRDEIELLPYVKKISVVPTMDDFKAVYTSLHQRSGHTPRNDPTPEAFAGWKHDFSDNLIMFGMAVAQALKAPVAHALDIKIASAYAHIQDNYLNKSPEEAEGLLTLAVFAIYELNPPANIFAPRPDKSIKEGLVLSKRKGTGDRYEWFELWHPNAGQLLLDASGRSLPAIKEDAFAKAAKYNPFFATILAHKLKLSGELSLAQRTLAIAYGGGQGILHLLGDNLTPAVSQIRLLIDSAVSQYVQIDQLLAHPSSFATLLDKTFATDFGFLTPFFKLSHEHLPLTYTRFQAALLAEVRRPQRNNRLLQAVWNSSDLNFAADFLNFAADNMRPVYESLVRAFAAERAKARVDNRLAQLIMNSSWPAVRKFLDVLMKKGNRIPYRSHGVGCRRNAETKYVNVAPWLLGELSRPGEFRQKYSSQLFTTHPDETQTLLAWSALFNDILICKEHEAIFPFYFSVLERLSASSSPHSSDGQGLLMRLWQSPLHRTTSVLRSCQELESKNRLRSVFDFLTAELYNEAVKPSDTSQFWRLLQQAPIPDICGFITMLRKHPEPPPPLTSHAARLCAVFEDAWEPAKHASQLVKASLDDLDLLIASNREIFKKTVHFLDSESWLGPFFCRPTMTAVGFGNLASLIEKSDQPFAQLFVEKLAKNYIEKCAPSHWANGPGLTDAILVLQLAQTSETAKPTFIDTIMSEVWLKQIILNEKLQPFSLAHSVLQVHSRLEANIKSRLWPKLEPLVTQKLITLLRTPPRPNDAKPIARQEEDKADPRFGVLQLWAAMEYAGADIPLPSTALLHWPADLAITSNGQLTNQIQNRGLGYIQQQTWMGLRTYARHHPDQVTVPENLLLTAIKQWKRTANYPKQLPVYQTRHQNMITWMQKCLIKKAGSERCLLIKDSAPLGRLLLPPAN